jgi:hypothetical protein
MEHHGTPWVATPEPPKNLTSPCTLPALAAAAAAQDAFDNSFNAMAVDDAEGSPVRMAATPPSSPMPVAASSSPSRPQAPPMLRRSSCDLFECIEQHKRLPEDTARYVFQQIVGVIAHLLTLGICHRDIKDENIVIDKHFRVRRAAHSEHTGAHDVAGQAHRLWISRHPRPAPAAAVLQQILGDNGAPACPGCNTLADT